jgi:hypothetical protein
MTNESSGMLRRVVLVRTDTSGGTYRLDNQIGKNQLVFLCCVLQLLVTFNVSPSSPILVILMMEAICSSETSVLTRATRRNVAEDGILRCTVQARFSLLSLHLTEETKESLCLIRFILTKTKGNNFI